MLEWELRKKYENKHISEFLYDCLSEVGKIYEDEVTLDRKRMILDNWIAYMWKKPLPHRFQSKR